MEVLLQSLPEETPKMVMMEDVCVYCGKELARMERNRAICWECRDKMNETYDEE